MIGKEYAKALYDLTSEEKMFIVLEQFTNIVNLHEENPELIKLLSSKRISSEKKKEFISDFFKAFDNNLYSLLLVLIDNDRYDLLKEICDYFYDMVLDKHDIVKVEIISKTELTNEEKEEVLKKIKVSLHKEKLIPEYIIDSSLIAGLVIKVYGKVLDISLKARINMLQKTI